MSTFNVIVIVGLVLCLISIVAVAVLVLRSKGTEEKKLRSVTRLLFVTTQVAALAWVSISYLIALYATVKLGQPFPVVELSQQAITAILGTEAFKTIQNIFEHNDGVAFGKTRLSGDSKTPANDTGTHF